MFGFEGANGTGIHRHLFRIRVHHVHVDLHAVFVFRVEGAHRAVVVGYAVGVFANEEFPENKPVN